MDVRPRRLTLVRVLIAISLFGAFDARGPDPLAGRDARIADATQDAHNPRGVASLINRLA